MFFKNLSIYRITENSQVHSLGMLEALSSRVLQPCAATDSQSIGWVPPFGDPSLVRIVNNQVLIALGVEQKLLPASVVKQFANDKAKAIEENEGRRVGRKEMREIRESVTLELLPRAFVRRRTTFGWIDPVNGWLIVDSASPARAEEFIEHLRRSVDGFPVRLLKVQTSPSAAMTAWVSEGDAPAGITIDQDLRLQSAERAQVTYAKHPLEGEDIRHQIADGKVATKLAMTWGDRISFVLTDTLQIKRIAFLDILKEQAGEAENEDERFDIDFTLMTGELAKMIADVVQALGGELAREAA